MARHRQIRIIIVDDQATVRRGLVMRLAVEPDLDVIGVAADGVDAVRLAASLRPDVVLMDVVMPGLDGIDATTAIRRVSPGSAVVLVSLYDDPDTIARVREAGARAFLAKHDADRVVTAVRAVAR